MVNEKRSLTVLKPETTNPINFSDQSAKRKLNITTKFNEGNLRRGFAYTFKPQETPADGLFLTVYCAADGTVFFGTRDKGLIEFKAGSFKSYTRENGLSDNTVSFIREDGFGNLWLISGWGVMKIARKGFVSYNTSDGLFADRIADIFTDRDGRTYAINAGWFINQFEGSHFASVKPNLPKDVGNYWIHRVIKDSAGEWWIATPKGLFRFPRVERLEELATVKPIAVYTKENDLADTDVTIAFEDRNRDVWIAYSSDEAKGKLTRWERARAIYSLLDG